jgi:hypothetical protein
VLIFCAVLQSPALVCARLLLHYTTVIHEAPCVCRPHRSINTFLLGKAVFARGFVPRDQLLLHVRVLHRGRPNARTGVSTFLLVGSSTLNHSESNYVSENAALSGGLATVSGDNNHFIIRTDNTTVLSASGPGRNSVRIISNNTYSTHVSM